MRDRIAKTLDAILTAWSKCLPHPYGSGEYSSVDDNQTDCNRFVNDAVENACGYEKLRGLTANQIVQFISASLEWMDVSGSVAQYHADGGAVVMAAWSNPDPAKSGHVCMVIPGQLGRSHNWNDDNEVPRVANVSTPKLCRLDFHANWAFSEKPRYFVLKTTIINGDK